jgi:hypothetical protein
MATQELVKILKTQFIEEASWKIKYFLSFFSLSRNKFISKVIKDKLT